MVHTKGYPESRGRKYKVLEGDIDYWGEKSIHEFARMGDYLKVHKKGRKFKIVAEYPKKK